MTALESKLDHLIARVEQTHTREDFSTTESPSRERSSVSQHSSMEPRRDRVFSQSVKSFPQEPQEGLRASSGSAAFDKCAHSDMNELFSELLSDQCALSIDDANALLSRFQKMSSYFPFVMLPVDATVHSMLSDRPFLLLAVLAAASSQDKLLQRTIETRLRVSLVHRIMIEGEKSTDLLQGSLVLLAW